jgi:phosphatidylglycerol:prolipoprotein diacylglycerol transferase
VEPSHPTSPRPDRDDDAAQPSPLRVSAFNCDALAEVKPHALGLTYEFLAAPEGDPYSVTIAFEGRRTGVKHQPRPGDRFAMSTTVERVLPGSGRVAVTTRVPDLTAGSWHVVARPSTHPIGHDRKSSGGSRAVLPRLPGGSAEGLTGWAPVITQKAPGVLLGSWAALVGLGAAVGLTVQAILAGLLGLPVFGIFLVSVLASLIGLVGAKLYYLAVYPVARRKPLNGGGMCIQGFVIGAAVGLIVGALAVGVQIGSLLDITAPGLMFGMTIGRFGCFFSGCCVGRPTASRWGLWSSDRRLGVRRIPTQLFESALAATIGVTALVVLVTAGLPELGGTVFIGALAAYVFGRQLLLPLRAESSKTQHGRAITLASAGIVLLAAIVVAIVTYTR